MLSLPTTSTSKHNARWRSLLFASQLAHGNARCTRRRQRSTTRARPTGTSTTSCSRTASSSSTSRTKESSAPYATENPRSTSSSSGYGANSGSGSIPQNLHGNQNGNNCESDAIWRRISDAIAQNVDKLSQIFFKMDITCLGSVSREEFELGMSHIGVFLTPREYEKVYDSFAPELKDFTNTGGGGSNNNTSKGKDAALFAVKYADFLALFHGKSPLVLPTTSKQTSSPQFEKINQRYVTPDTFRDCLLRCGLALSGADYAALRVRLLPLTYARCGNSRASSPYERSETNLRVYKDAELRHAQGIRVLMDNFDYHPEFKRLSDMFSAALIRTE